MKKKLYSISTILAITAMFSLSSCLKDSKNYVNVSQSPPLAELPLEEYYGIGNLAPISLAASTTPQVVQVAVDVAVAKALSSATTFNLAVDNAYVFPSGYSLLPAADYSVSNWTVTVPAGQNVAYLNINVNSSLIGTANTTYILPIKLVSSNITIDQFNELPLNITEQ